MRDKITVSGSVTNGHLPPDIVSSIRNALHNLEGKIARITIERQKKRRSLNQNAFYWGVVIPCVVEVLEDYGNEADADMAHEVAKHCFLPDSGKRRVSMNGAPLCETLTSATLSTIEWEDYMTKIRAFCAENGVQVPLPNEVDYY